MKIGVILYVNRSGSTLFSRLLSDASATVVVFPELAALPALLLAAQDGRTIAGQDLADLLCADIRIDAVGLPREVVRRIARDHSSADLPALLAALARERQGVVPDALVVKLESLAYLADAIERALPGAAMFHVVRDPRAVVASMRNTPVPEKPGFDMARGSIVYAARHWRRYQHVVAAIARRRPVDVVRYERLVADPAGVCTRALAVLGITSERTAPGRYRVAAIDAPLHRRIDGAMDASRAAAWQERLTSRETRVVEAICHEEMVVLGYAPTGPRARPLSATMVGARARHVATTAWHAVRTALVYARKPDALASLSARLRLARAARRTG